jgi:hypothetical protein
MVYAVQMIANGWSEKDAVRGVVVYIRKQSQHSPGGTEENYERSLSQYPI